MENIECAICFDAPFLPIQLICPQKCNPQSVMCYKCAKQLLQIDAPSHRRVESLKCLFCPEIVARPRIIGNVLDIAMPNLPLMMVDTTVHPCPNDGCSFTGQQLDIFHHLKKCDYRPVRCGEYVCSQTFPFIRKDDHMMQCRAFRTCGDCMNRIPAIDLSAHMDRMHGKRRCMHCTQYQPKDGHECEMRPVRCEWCSMVVPKNSFPGHYKEDVNSLNRVIKVYDAQMTILNSIPDCAPFDVARHLNWLRRNTDALRSTVAQLEHAISSNQNK